MGRERVIWRALLMISNIGNVEKSLKVVAALITIRQEGRKVGMGWSSGVGEDYMGFEISIRFRQIIEERIARLEADSSRDEAAISQLEDDDHIRRQMRLVAVQRADATRMRNFLDRSPIRVSRSVSAL
ncbi:MAG TPA: hypothetical protein VGF82_23525 [Terracidiphilus sp.]